VAAPTVHTNTVVLVEILPRYSAHHFCIVFHLALLRINICDVIIVLPGYHWVVTHTKHGILRRAVSSSSEKTCCDVLEDTGSSSFPQVSSPPPRTTTVRTLPVPAPGNTGITHCTVLK